MRRLLALLICALAAGVLIVACGGGDDRDHIGDLPIFSGTGTIAVAVTDAPIDLAVSAVIQFSGVALQRLGAPETVFRFDPPLRIDLLALGPTEAATLLPLTTVSAGPYGSMRLLVDAGRDTLASHLVLAGGAVRPLFIPTGAESGLRISDGFVVPAGGLASFTIDFDLRKSVIAPNTPLDAFELIPHLRRVDNDSLGAISGFVSPATLANASCPFPQDPRLNTNLVYIFEGANTRPDDIDDGGVEPISTERVDLEFTGGVYTAAFLPPGFYTVAFTCQGASENPLRSDNLTFLGTRNVLVNEFSTTLLDF